MTASKRKAIVQALEQHLKTAENIKKQGIEQNNPEMAEIGENLAASYGVLIMVAENRL